MLRLLNVTKQDNKEVYTEYRYANYDKSEWTTTYQQHELRSSDLLIWENKLDYVFTKYGFDVSRHGKYPKIDHGTYRL